MLRSTTVLVAMLGILLTSCTEQQPTEPLTSPVIVSEPEDQQIQIPDPVICSDYKYKSDRVIVMACNIQKEAGNQSFEGKLFVGHVTLNRMNTKVFPDTVHGVVFQKYQFSWTHQDTKSKKPEQNSWGESYRAAKAVLDGKFRTSASWNQALWYHANYVRPKWASAEYMKQCGVIGDHIAYCPVNPQKYFKPERITG